MPEYHVLMLTPSGGIHESTIDADTPEAAEANSLDAYIGQIEVTVKEIPYGDEA